MQGGAKLYCCRWMNCQTVSLWSCVQKLSIESLIWQRKRGDLWNGEEKDGEKVAQETKYSHHSKQNTFHNPNTHIHSNFLQVKYVSKINSGRLGGRWLFCSKDIHKGAMISKMFSFLICLYRSFQKHFI